VRVIQQRVLSGQFSVLHVHDQKASSQNSDQQNEDSNADHDSDGREALRRAILFLLIRSRIVRVEAIAFRTVANGGSFVLAVRGSQILKFNVRSATEIDTCH
jgi:hypothetical protein